MGEVPRRAVTEPLEGSTECVRLLGRFPRSALSRHGHHLQIRPLRRYRFELQIRPSRRNRDPLRMRPFPARQRRSLHLVLRTHREDLRFQARSLKRTAIAKCRCRCRRLRSIAGWRFSQSVPGKLAWPKFEQSLSRLRLVFSRLRMRCQDRRRLTETRQPDALRHGEKNHAPHSSRPQSRWPFDARKYSNVIANRSPPIEKSARKSRTLFSSEPLCV